MARLYIDGVYQHDVEEPDYDKQLDLTWDYKVGYNAIIVSDVHPSRFWSPVGVIRYPNSALVRLFPTTWAERRKDYKQILLSETLLSN